MDSIKITVPRVLVKEHGMHPEPYGESVVDLVNGMYTDVYTNDAGKLFTMTNDTDLINYLSENYSDYPDITYISNGFRIRTIQFEDTNLLKKWMNSSENWLMKEQEYSEDDIRLYISHAITSESHFFIIETDNNPLGTLSYELHGDDLLVDLRIYDKSAVNDDDIKEIFGLFKEHINKCLKYSKMVASVLEEDVYHVRLFDKLGFIKVESKSFKTTVYADEDKKTLVFEYGIKDEN